MDFVLIIITGILGILGVLIEPVKEGKGSIWKRLTNGGKVAICLLIIVTIISVVKQVSDNNEAKSKEEENEYLKLRPFAIGPAWKLRINFKDSVLLNLENHYRNKELDYIGNALSNRLQSLTNSSDSIVRSLDAFSELYSKYVSFYVDSISRNFLFPFNEKSRKKKASLNLNIIAGRLSSDAVLGADGLFVNVMNISSNKEYKVFGAETKESIISYKPNRILFYGKFDTTINGGALYQSIINQLKIGEESKSAIEYILNDKFKYEDIAAINRVIRKIKNIEVLIESDVDAFRYFVIDLVPTLNYKESSDNNMFSIKFPLKISAPPKEYQIKTE